MTESVRVLREIEAEDWDPPAQMYAGNGDEMASDPWADVDEGWRQELPDITDGLPGVYAYQDGITPDDWEIAERVTRRYTRNTNDRALAVSAVDRDIEDLRAQLASLEATKAEVSSVFDRREEYLKWRYWNFLQAFTAAATQGKRERYVQIVNTRLSLTHKGASLAVVNESAALEWAEMHTPGAVKKTLQKTPLSKWFKEQGEVPAGCELVPESDAFSMKVGG